MSDRLLIRLHPDGRLSWLALDAGGRALSASNAGAPPPGAVARARSIVVLVPSERVVVLETDAIGARRAQLVKAVPFALEDQLASPVEELHFALAPGASGGRVVVAVVARDVLRDWIDALAQHGLRADSMIPDALALASPPGACLVAIEDERTLLRGSAAQALACDTSALDAWLRIAAPAQLDVHDFRDAPRLALPVAVASYHERRSDLLAFIGERFAGDAAINLLQGDFAPAHRRQPLARVWRRAALLAVAAVVVALLFAAGDWLRLRRESDRLERAQREVLRTSAPELAEVAGDPRSLMESAMRRVRGDAGAATGLLPLLGRIAPTLSNSTRVQLTGIEFRNATLELGLRAPDVAALDLVREQIANLGLAVEVTAANSGATGVDGRLRIGGGKT